MVYRVEIKPAARRDLDRIAPPNRPRIAAAVDALALNPRPAGVKKLHEADGDRWRIRVGDYRVVYRIHDDVLFVLVVAIGHRREVYRRR